MPDLTLTDTTPGSTSDANANLNDNWTAIKALINGGLDTDNLAVAAGVLAAQLASAVREAAGLNDGTSVRRGKSIIATEESRTNVAYGLLTTPDRVSSIVLPTDGLIRVTFRALVKNSVASAGSVALFVGANQLKKFQGFSAPVVIEVAVGSAVDDYNVVYSDPANGLGGEGGAGAASSVTTGLQLRDICIEAAAGTYDVSVQFKASSGSITAKERKLWVEAVGF